MSAKKKQEALLVTRLINEVLVGQLSIPLRQIVNDTTFKEFTGSKRPDLLISEFEYDKDRKNHKEFIGNLVACAEVKDDATLNDSAWKSAKKDGKNKSERLGLPYYIVTNGKVSVFYNSQTDEELKLNNNPIREFQTIDILRLIKSRLGETTDLQNIITNVDSLTIISEAIFNKKLWELAKVYRNINFENGVEKIDFTIGFVALEYFEETQEKRDTTKIYWSDCSDGSETFPAEKIVANLAQYIQRLEQESQFKEFTDLMEKVRVAITGKEGDGPLVKAEFTKQIYDIINSMIPLHGCGFDLFGAVYEMFANKNEKKEFGEFFTRRHYAHILSKLLFKQEEYFNNNRKFKVLDPACGTGGFLTEGFKVLHANYTNSMTFDKVAKKFLEDECFYGIDVRKENISRTKLNMFLVGDGHTNMVDDNTLLRDFDGEEYDYIITNPPYGAGTVKADTEAIS